MTAVIPIAIPSVDPAAPESCGVIPISREEVEKVSLLGRLLLSEDELETMTTQMGQILGDMELLDEDCTVLEFAASLDDDELISIFPRDKIHVLVVGGETNGYWRIMGCNYSKSVSIDEWR